MTVECEIEQKHHRSIMGAKGVNVQGITQEFNVGIKFPDRNPANAPSQATGPEDHPVLENGSAEEEAQAGKGGAGPNPRNVIVITGRAENVAGAKQALLVSSSSCVVMSRFKIKLAIIPCYEIDLITVGRCGCEFVWV